MKKLLAFHNKKSVKAKYLKRLEAHYKADEIIHGIYWEKGKGCAVGCTVEKDQDAHEAMEKELGIPQTVAYLEDRIFENLENGESKKFPLKFLKAIPVGADLSLVTEKFMVWLLVDPKDGVIRFTKGYKDCSEAIKYVANLYKRRIKGEVVKDEEFAEAAAEAAGAAWAAEAAGAAGAAGAAWAAWAARAASAAAGAAWAAWAAGAAWAARAANAAAGAARAARADRAARAARAASAARAARAAAYKKMAAKLISLLKDAPVKKV